MESPSHFSQCPAASAMGRRTVEVTSEESPGVKTSKPEVCERGLFDSPATAAAQTQTASTKPRAGTLACRWPSDESEETSLEDQSPLPSLTLKGTVCLESTDPRRTFSVHASITENASVSAAHQHGAQWLNRNNITREDSKSQYYRDLCLQIEERKQQMERERNRNVADEQKHNDTMQHTFWGMPGSGAPNYHLGTARRSRSLRAAGILPQEQVNKAPDPRSAACETNTITSPT